MVETTQERRTLDLAERIVKLEADCERDPASNADELAVAYLEDGRPYESIQLLEKIGESRSFEGQLLLAQSYFDVFDLDNAKRVLNAARTQGNLDDQLRAQLILGEIAIETGAPEEAKPHLQRVLDLSPHNRRAAQLLSNLGEQISVPPGEDDDGNSASTASYGLEPRERRETPRRAFAHVALGLVVCAASLAVYLWAVNRSHAAKVLVVQALPLAERGDVASLRAAEKKFKEALEVHSGNEHARAGLAEIYASLWVLHGLTSAKEDAHTWTQAAVEGEIEKAERYGAQALVAVGDGRYDAAETIAESVTRRGGISEKLYYAVGLAQRATGKVKVGRDNLRRAQELNSSAPHYATALGDAYDEDGDSRNAAIFWALAAKINSSYVVGAARDLLARTRRGEAREKLQTELDRLLQLPEEFVGPLDVAAIHHVSAAVAYRDGKSEEALKEIDAAIALAGPKPRHLALRARTLLLSDQIPEGLALYEKALAAAPKSVRYAYEFARALRDSGNFDRSLTVLSDLSKRLGEDTTLRIAMADTHLAKGDPSQAKAIYEKVLEVAPETADAQLGLGRIEAAKKNYDAARTWYEKAVAAEPNSAGVYEAVGLMWIEQRAYGDASTQLEVAEKMYRQNGADFQFMTGFYDRVTKAYSRARRATSYARTWGNKEKAFRAGT